MIKTRNNLGFTFSVVPGAVAVLSGTIIDGKLNDDFIVTRVKCIIEVQGAGGILVPTGMIRIAQIAGSGTLENDLKELTTGTILKEWHAESSQAFIDQECWIYYSQADPFRWQFSARWVAALAAGDAVFVRAFFELLKRNPDNR